MAASNSIGCMESFVGGVVVGVLVGEFGPGTWTFLFHGPRAFTFNHNGAFWEEDKRSVQRALDKLREEITKNDLLLKALAEHS